jgi:hypothetical protein
MALQEHLFADDLTTDPRISTERLIAQLINSSWNKRQTSVRSYTGPETNISVPVFTNEFWTSRQRADTAHSLHEISYRACFKPQLPAFFIRLLTHRGDCVYDPFAGRGTTLIETALRGRTPAGCDVNPLSETLILPRLAPPRLRDVLDRLTRVDLKYSGPVPENLLAFYHPDTLSEICALRDYLLERRASEASDQVDDWIRMVAVNRLTGHSPGFLSVYTLPPNQAVSVEAQRKINADRRQTPPRRDVRAVIARKTKSLLADVDDDDIRVLADARTAMRFRVGSCVEPSWESGIFQLIVTSPPFLDVVDYATDNWLRCWFCDVDARAVPIELHRAATNWAAFIKRAFREFERLLRPGGFVAFEVGEVRGGAVRLEEFVLPCGTAAGLHPVCVVVNDQRFTKTANIWGVSNNSKGTNTNRIVVFQKPAGATVSEIAV